MNRRINALSTYELFSIFALLVLFFTAFGEKSTVYAVTDPKIVSPPTASNNCWRLNSSETPPAQPQYPPTPFFYAPFDAAWTGNNWSTTMDHSYPKYSVLEGVSSLGENLSDPNTRTTYWNANHTIHFDYYFSPSLEVDLGYDGHDGNDFSTTGNARSVAAGQIVRIKTNDTYLGNYVDIYHPEGYMTRYAHLASVASGLVNGSPVQAGSIIGVIGTTGNSTGVHLHLSVYRWNSTRVEWEITDPFGWDPWRSPGQQGDDPLFNCNGEISYNLWFGGWPQPVSGPSSSADAPSIRYIGGWLSEDIATNDTTPPTGLWTNPNNGQMFSSRTVTLSVNASDNSGGSGVREVRWAALYNNEWHGIGTVYSSPYSLNWDWCAAGAQNGDVELGFEIWDNANKQWIYGNTYPNIHISKNYDCSNGGPIAWSMNFYNGSTHYWDINNTDSKICSDTYNGPNLDRTYGDYVSPCPGGAHDNWVGDYKGTVNFLPATYLFEVEHDDGLKIFIDGQEYYSVTGTHNEAICHNLKYLSGDHQLWVILREDGGQARVKVNWSTNMSPCAPEQFNKSYPSNGQPALSLNPTLSWGASNRALSYEYCVDTNNNNNCDGSWQNTGTNTSAIVGNLTSSKTYYWQVRAVNRTSLKTEANNGIWWSFTTQANAPSAFNKTSPTNAATTQPTSLNLGWASSPGASWYQYCYDTTNNNTCDNDMWYSAGTDNSASISDLAENTTYYWQVRASNAGGTTNANGNIWWSFTTQIPSFNLLMRPGFEEDDMRSWWSYDAWTLSNSVYIWDFVEKHSGNKSVKILSNLANDAYWKQTVQVQQNADYRLSGWIKTDNVAHITGDNWDDAGANLSILDGMGDHIYSSPKLFGDNPWTHVTLDFNTGSNTEIDVAGRLGMYSGTTTGIVWFDDLKLELLSTPTCYTLTKTINSTNGGGLLTVPPPNCNNGTQYIHGTVVALRPLSSQYSTFSNWTGDAIGSANPLYVNMTGSWSITANFTQAGLQSFGDVSTGYWAWNFIERLFSAGITGGCNVSPPSYCPEATVTRAQMAVFLLRGIHGSSYSPPAVADNTGFGDVSTTYWASAWIKQLAAEGITGGCGSGNYCPESPVTRAQMAIFLLRSKYGASYSPPAVEGNTGFTDVAPTYWSGAWIKQLVAEGITAGCGAGTYCPESPVTRAQMAVFLVKTFNLP